VYRSDHDDCEVRECKKLTSYIRIDGKWTKIGYFGTNCKKFFHVDHEQEKRSRELRDRLKMIRSSYIRPSKCRHTTYL